jgi:hypothetical protein
MVTFVNGTKIQKSDFKHCYCGVTFIDSPRTCVTAITSAIGRPNGPPITIP